MRRWTSRGLAAAAIIAWAGTAALAADEPPARAPMKMAPGDELTVTLANYKQYTGTYAVDPDGNVTLPDAGKIHVQGMTGAEAAAAVQDAMWKVLVNQPSVVVNDTHRVSVLGEVSKPGIYQVDGTERITDLVARAGGTTPGARLSRMRVTRGDRTIPMNLKEALSGGMTLTQLGLEPGDVLYVPAKPILLDWRNWTTIISGAYISVTLYDRLRGK